MGNKPNMQRVLYHSSRIVLGLTFIFSGFVKGQDPLGTAFKLEDYFIAFGWEWALPFALILSILLCTFEFGIGTALLFNLKTRWAAWLTLLTMIFFTGLTLHDAITNPVPDCGCFGDAIKLSNWQTFYKNIALLAFALLMLYSARQAQVKFPGRLYGFLAGFVLFAAFSVWSYYHVPVLDFLPYKVGTDFNPTTNQPAQYFLTYKNKITGETREMLAADIPYTDSTWMAQWEYVSTRVYDPAADQRPDIHFTDTAGNDVTAHYLLNPDYQFIVTIYDASHASNKALQKLASILRQANQEGHSVIILCPATPEEIEKMKEEFGLDYEFFSADDIQLKMMVRANPGLMLLRGGKILGKWNGHSLPSYERLKTQYLSKNP
ncbi:MAG: BT_3928 family protein [Bacteroidales bacterium]